MPPEFSPDQLSDPASWHNVDPDSETLERLRAICLPFPDVVEAGGVGSPSYKVRDKIIGMRHPMRLASGDRPSFWCKARPGVQQMLVGSAPERFAVPPYVGHNGWIAIFLDGDVDWDELADLAEESYRMTATKRQIAQLDASR